MLVSYKAGVNMHCEKTLSLYKKNPSYIKMASQAIIIPWSSVKPANVEVQEIANKVIVITIRCITNAMDIL